MFGGHRGFGYDNYSAMGRDYNHNGRIDASDFREGAYKMGYGEMGADVAQSAFNAFDRNHNGYLDGNDIGGAYGYLDRLYR